VTSAVDTGLLPPLRSPRSRVMRRLLRNPGALIGAVILVAMILGAVFAPVLAPFDWDEADVGAHLSPPDDTFYLGTDLHGRDILSRILYGGRFSLAIGVATVTLSLVVGSAIGILIGFIGGKLDEIGARMVDVMLGFPAIVMSILVVAVLGVGIENAVIAVGISGVPRFARVVRAASLSAKQQLYVEAARALGAGNLRIMLRHLLPNLLPTLIVLATLDLGNAIISTATLSFLGLGAQPPTPEWGAMLNSGREYMRYAPWTMIFPGLALFLAVMSVNLLGDRLSQLLDPRTRERG
jgi:ABC-type dipeptide/oligopeptide/nickel transport system permease subunit